MYDDGDYTNQKIDYDDPEIQKLLAESDEENESGFPTKKKGQQCCPICFKLIWKNSVAFHRHIFKNHVDELLDTFGSQPCEYYSVPYSLYIPATPYSNSGLAKSDTLIDPTKNSLVVGGEETHGHGEDDRYKNPLTGRMKLFHKKRPEPPMKFLYFCFICEMAWTSKKTATKHFITNLGVMSPCCGKAQHEKIKWFQDKRKGIITAKPTNEIIQAVAPVAPVITVDNTALVVTVENAEVEELKKEIAIQKKKLIKFTTMSVEWTKEKEKLNKKLEQAEHQLAIKEHKEEEKVQHNKRTKRDTCSCCKQEDLSMAMGTCSKCKSKCHYMEMKYNCQMLYCELNECQKPICFYCNKGEKKPTCSDECRKKLNQNHRNDLDF